jgi:oligoendopeptidase F
MTQTKSMPARSEVPIEETWNLEGIYATEEAWEAAYQQVEAEFPSIHKFQGRLADGPEVLLAYFQTAETIYREVGKIFVYASLGSAVDSTDQVAAARSGQARSLYARVSAANAFAEPELMAVGAERLREWMQVSEPLKVYAHYFDSLDRQKEHIRSGDVEEVMAMASDPLASAMSTYGILTNAEMKFDPAVDKNGGQHELGQSTVDALTTNQDREIRRTAWENYADGYLGLKNTLASTLTGALKRDVFNMRARGYTSSLEAALKPGNIPLEVFHTLIDIFKENLPTWHRYWGVRKKVLGYDKLHFYDTRSPMSKNAPVVPFETAVEWICEGMRPLGEDYVQAMRKGCLEERWVDWAINKGKRAGAFSSGVYDTNPFIMMSYASDLFSVSTLAHELGHSMHSYYSRKDQPWINAHYSIFVAEVASNFNQALLRAHLFETLQDRDSQIALIDEAMSNFRRYFFIMPTLARFELDMHERTENGKPINADLMIQHCASLFQEGFGDHLEFDHDRMGIMWAQFGHLYNNFYVYQYATGISGAHALAADVLAGEEGAADKYLDFLKAGGSKYPLDALKIAGVDLTDPGPVRKAFEDLADIVTRLEELAD